MQATTKLLFQKRCQNCFIANIVHLDKLHAMKDEFSWRILIIGDTAQQRWWNGSLQKHLVNGLDLVMVTLFHFNVDVEATHAAQRWIELLFVVRRGDENRAVAG